MATFSLRKEDVKKDWIVVDASGASLGRLAAVVASRLRGKHKPEFTPHVDCGDHVIVTNAEKVRLTGHSKLIQQKYYKHTGYPGGIKEATAKDVLAGRFPERVVEKAVQRMLPKGPLGRKMFSNLRVYPGAEHPHEAQAPQGLDLSALNPKNTRSINQ